MMHRRRGSAQIYALALMLVLSLAASATWRATLMQTTESYRSARHTQARLLAEAGLEHARARLAEGETFAPAWEAQLGPGFYRVTLTEADRGVARLTSTGELRDGDIVLHEFTLHAVVRLGTRTP